MNPPIARTSMAYKPFKGKPLFPPQWPLLKSILIRRFIYFGLVLISTFFGAKTIITILSSGETSQLSWSIVSIFTILFAWIASTFWTVLLGFITLLRHHEPMAVARPPYDAKINPATRVAIVMPVYNEDVPRIFAGLQTMYESLEETGYLKHFDFYILSDTTKPDHCAQEEVAWKTLCDKVEGKYRIFYRHRKIRLHKKSGNISDFCRRWGSKYTYMLPLDADSIMSGHLMVDLVKILESRLDVGIIQTAPKGINQHTLGARLQQFTSYVYGPLHLAGFHFWELNDAGFWGHNALLRMEPFIKYCALPKLRGNPPFGGDILSHDFVEAALMRRAGWGVWLAYDFEESFEELPPNLIEELRRDSRWCQGNLQHLRLMFWRGFSFGHRLLFLNGNMAYFSALLWFMLLVLMTIYAIVDFFHQPQYFPDYPSLFPQWPIHYRGLSLELLIVTLVFLFGPKILSLVWMSCSRQKIKRYGGWPRLILSVLLETVFSIFLAPIKMVFHAWFILSHLFPKKLEWNKQQRNVEKLTFGEVSKNFGFISVAAIVWGFLVASVNHSLFIWLLPIIIPLVFSIPVVILASYRSAGEFFLRHRLFLTPVESKPPEVVLRLNDLVAEFSKNH